MSARDLAATVREALDNEHPWTCGCDRSGNDSCCILVETYSAVDALATHLDQCRERLAALEQQAADAQAALAECRAALDGGSEPYQDVYNAACERADEAEARAVRAEEALRQTRKYCPDCGSPIFPDAPYATGEFFAEGPPPGYVIPEGDARCSFVMDACICMKRKGHDGLHACAHGGWRAAAGADTP